LQDFHGKLRPQSGSTCDFAARLVLDDFGGRLGRAWREVDEESTDQQP
jgi:hypothetical protein